MISHVKFISVPVSDYDRALKFYSEKLGFTLITDQKFNDDSRWIEMQVGKSETKVVLFTPTGHENRIGTSMNMAFTCADVNTTYEELKLRGVEFKVPPTTAPWGTYAQFVDSEGNIFVLSST
ncbi:MAG: VOC family protein [Ignavibacteriales bacterium]|nr:VOC family protein [Ignavibacteriales bacterium]